MALLEKGYRQQMAGHADAAESCYRQVLRADGNNFHALNLLGMLCINSGRSQEAVDLLRRALHQDEGDPQTHANLGLALKDTRQLSEAVSALRKALALDPNNPVTHNNLGNVLMALQEHAAAADAYRHALKLRPDYVECLSNLAGALKETGNLNGALAAADHALALQPNLAEAHNNRGEVLFRQARFAEAVTSYRAAIAHGENYIAASINLSAALKEVGDIAAAKTVLEDALHAEPKNPRAHNNLGVLLEQLGDGEQAAEHFRAAIRLSPDYGNAYYQLAQLRGHGLNDAEVKSVEALLSDTQLAQQQRVPLHFALACACDSRGDFDGAFAHLSLAQSTKAARNPYNDAKVAGYYNALARDAGALAHTPAASETPTPVFVLGMPRSGTSLTEQILDSHPDVCGAGELSFMEDTIKLARRMVDLPFPACVARLSAQQTVELGEYYLDRLRAKADDERMVVDKTPMNFQYIGFIAALLPAAKFVHCRRNPIDNCLSIFKLPFEDAHSYSHSLESLGQYYAHYQALMAHWSGLVGERMIDIVYEDVVTDFEGQTRRLLDFLDLPFDESVLRFHQSRRIVKTPSASQVRRPIYTSSVEKWRKYDAHLGPLIALLGDDRNA